MATMRKSVSVERVWLVAANLDEVTSQDSGSPQGSDPLSRA